MKTYFLTSIILDAKDFISSYVYVQQFQATVDTFDVNGNKIVWFQMIFFMFKIKIIDVRN